MKKVIGRLVQHPMQFAAASLLATGLLVSAVMSTTTRTSVGSTNTPTNAGYGYDGPAPAKNTTMKPGYGHEGSGQAKGHRMHCPSQRGQQRSGGHAVCHLAPRHGR
jgi:hypothetical protein